MELTLTWIIIWSAVGCIEMHKAHFACINKCFLHYIFGKCGNTFFKWRKTSPKRWFFISFCVRMAARSSLIYDCWKSFWDAFKRYSLDKWSCGLLWQEDCGSGGKIFFGKTVIGVTFAKQPCCWRGTCPRFALKEPRTQKNADYPKGTEKVV